MNFQKYDQNKNDNKLIIKYQDLLPILIRTLYLQSRFMDSLNKEIEELNNLNNVIEMKISSIEQELERHI